MWSAYRPKFEVSRCIRYEAMNRGAKCRKWGGLGVVRGHSGSSAMSPFDRAHATSYSTLIESVCLSSLSFSRYSQTNRHRAIAYTALA